MQAIYEFDYSILNWIQTWTTPFLDKFFGLITHLGDGGLFWIGIALLLLCFKKTRKCGACMGLALAMGFIICNLTLKPMFNRVRPWCNTDFAYLIKTTAEEILTKTSKLPPDSSFPSGHTLASFEASVALFCCNKKMGIPALFVAAAVALSRLYLYFHYPSDVLFSLFLGIGLGIASYFIVTAFIKHKLPAVIEKIKKLKTNKA